MYRKQILFSVAASMLLAITSTSAFGESASFKSAAQNLSAKKYSEKQSALEKLVNSYPKKSTSILEAVLDSRLYYVRATKEIVFIEKSAEGYILFDIETEKTVATAPKSKIKKITLNNKLRRYVKNKLAELTLHHKNPKKRLQAAKALLKNITPERKTMLEDALNSENESNIQKVLKTGIAMAELDHPDIEKQIQAASFLSGTLQRNAQTLLVKKLDSLGDVETENQKTLKSTLENTLQKTNRNVFINQQVENALFGLSLGSVLFLAAVGLAITFGVMGVINLAHGEMIMLGAYTTYVVQLLMPNYIDLSIIVAIPAAFIVAGLFGIVIERTIIRYLYGRPLDTLLATFGLSLILQQLVRSVFSPLNRAVATPSWMSGSLSINPSLSVTYNRIYIIIFSVIVLVVLFLLLKKTVYGLHMRAVTQDRNMAKAMGIKSNWIDALTFGLGSGIAGMAGVALSQLTNVGPNMGQTYIVDSFMVVVFGGVGNLFGTFLGGLTLGVANKFLEPAFGAVLAKILILVFIILFIQKRPRGMFALKGRAAED
jgi:urea transport system permease protein